MTDKFIGSIMFLIAVLAVTLYLAPFTRYREGLSGMSELANPGSFPNSDIFPILNSYPFIGKNVTSNNNYNQIWWHNPIFPLGSYKQITNNLRYRYNPDDGNCIRADFCGALYHNQKHTKSNIIKPLPPAQEGPGARVGYFRTEPNELYFSIPTNENILY